MHTWLVELGVPVVTPAAPERRAGNIAFLADDPLKIVAALRAEGVFAWGGEGRVRFSTHIYNDLADVERGRDALRKVL